MKDITFEMLKEYRECCEDDRSIRTLSAAAAKTELGDLAFLPMQAAKLNGDFSIELKTGKVTAQQKSGRCWMFAAMNIIRRVIAANCGLPDLELSGNYLGFYDKLEKANNILEMVIEYADRPLDDRMTAYILNGFWDGGYWDMASDLVKKYGVVPAAAMPETYQSSHTDAFVRLLNRMLRKDAAELRAMIAEGKDPAERKAEMLGEIYKAECIAYGTPPETFNFEYRDRSGVYHSERDLTPQEFYERYAGVSLDDYVTVTNEPTHTKKLNMYYSFHYIGNMAGRDVRCLNLPMDELEELCIKQLEDGEPVWFSCDHEAYGDRKEGVWDPDSFDYDGLLGGVDLFMDKGERLEYRNSSGTHAMILTGVNFDDYGRPDRWKIENSWGSDAGRKGFFVCSEKYFREYVYEGIINRKHLSEEQAALLETEPAVLMPWEE